MSNTIWCFIIGDHKIFEVTFDPAGSVDGLKDRIKAKKSGDLKDIDADNLILYRAEVDDSIDKQKKTRIVELKRLSENLSECLELDDEKKLLSKYLGEGKKYYTLVQLPEGKSID
jgi:hypothetical protein